MRKLIGFIFTIATIPILSLLLVSGYKEWHAVTTIDEFLSNNVKVDDVSLPTVSYITAADGTVISEISNDERRIYLSYERIPQVLKDAFIIVEDQNFFNHNGIDFIATGRAILENAKHDQIEQGGSSITQQLAKNLYLTQEKSYNRKLTELLYSYQLERQYSKEKILELYINAIYYGNSAYGIEAAAKRYFNKPAKSLSEGELLFLAGIPNNPSLYDPFKRFEQAKERQERIIDQMENQGKLNPEQAAGIKDQTISLQSEKPIDSYPDYVTYVEKEFKSLIASAEGLSEKLNSNDSEVVKKAEKALDEKITELKESGITIHTALDKTLQKKAKRAINRELSGTDIEAATVVIQHHTHELVSLTGAKDYNKHSFHRGFQSYRQPGSAIKPLLVYGPYIDQTNASVNDLINSNRFCKNGYCPKNYAGGSYGYVSIKKAFARSYNTSAVRMMNQTGIETSFSYLERFQFQKVNKTDYRLPAAIGGFEYGMTPLELTNAFTSFQNGFYEEARAIRHIKDKDGKIIYQWKNKKPVLVWKPETATKMKTLLEAVIKEGTARKAVYSTTSKIGGKTGTTNDVKDLWFIGYNKNYTTGVWVGKDIPKNIEYIGQPHLAIWKSVMK